MTKPARLLLVHPSKAIVDSMTKHLHEFGFLVQAVATGEKAIESAVRRKPDLVVADIKLPGMSGYELCGRLRAMADVTDVPVLLFVTSMEIETSGVARQTENYLVNASDLSSLTRRVRDLVATYKRHRIIEDLMVRENAPMTSERTQDLTSNEQEILRRAGANLENVDLGANDPTLMGEMDYLNLLESSLNTAQVGKMLRVNESRVRQRLTSQPPSLFGIKRDAEWLIPSFQFAGKRLVPNLERVIAKLDAKLHPVSVWRWFTTPDADLTNEQSPPGGFSPRDWMLRGFPVEVVERLAEELHLT